MPTSPKARRRPAHRAPALAYRPPARGGNEAAARLEVDAQGPALPDAAKREPAAAASPWVRLDNVSAPLSAGLEPQEHLRTTVATKLGLRPEQVSELRVVRRALDARRGRVGRSFVVDVRLAGELGARAVRRGRAQPAPVTVARRLVLPRIPDGPPPVVVGAGPAGLFAALTLAEAGWPAVLLERGRAVDERTKAVSKLYARGELDQESNVCFGEGGAGTYSDGKLYTRVGDARVQAVMRKLVALGADPDILVHNRPHLGTDKLVGLLRRIRARLLELGSDVRFGAQLTGMRLHDGAVAGLSLQNGARLDARGVVLATGHSARDVYTMLQKLGLPLQVRPFAVGVRVEHPQGLIDRARYGLPLAEGGELPAADYRLTYQDRGAAQPRAAFSFCMCPGGVVVTTPTEEGALCINGMSHAARSGRYANSAIVATVGPEDFAREGFVGTFAGVQFQDQIERAAFVAGGGKFTAPASRLADFVAGRVSTDLPKTSYRRGIVPADVAGLFPAQVAATLRRAIARFDAQIPGFAGEEAVCIGVETRTAAPVRLPRNAEGEAEGARGLFPAGEGLGYGGGIVSAAVDGMRAAEALLLRHGASWQATQEAA